MCRRLNAANTSEIRGEAVQSQTCLGSRRAARRAL